MGIYLSDICTCSFSCHMTLSVYLALSRVVCCFFSSLAVLTGSTGLVDMTPCLFPLMCSFLCFFIFRGGVSDILGVD